MSFGEMELRWPWVRRVPASPSNAHSDGASPNASRAKHSDPSLERLADELEIRNLVARIAHLADMSDSLDDYLACFSEDAIWQFGGNPHEGLHPVRVEGREALRADRLARRARGVQGPGTPNRHVITTLAVEVRDGHFARAESYFLLLTDTTDSPRIRNTGHYLDHFVRTTEGWKLATREITTG